MSSDGPQPQPLRGIGDSSPASVGGGTPHTAHYMGLTLLAHELTVNTFPDPLTLSVVFVALKASFSLHLWVVDSVCQSNGRKYFQVLINDFEMQGVSKLA